MQQGLAQWQTFLADKHLPILARTKKDVQALIAKPQLSITQYATPIVYDAGFCAHVFRHVNTQRVSSGKNPLTTMSNALSHLGQGAFQTFLNKTTLLEKLALSEKNTQGYMRAMGQSCHGALQATEWALQRNVVETEETQLAALLQNITELMLWCYGDDVMPEIEELCYVKKQNYEQAAKNILGCGMRELGAKLANKWNLPEMAADGLISKQDNFTLATGVSLAAELARIVDINWYGKNANEIFTRIAKYKGKSEGEIEHRLHLNAVNVNDIMLDKGYAPPAKLLFQLADDEYQYPQFMLEKEAPEIADEKTDNVKDLMAANASNVKLKGREEKKSADISSREKMVEKIKARKLAAKQVEDKAGVKPSANNVSAVERKAVFEKIMKRKLVEKETHKKQRISKAAANGGKDKASEEENKKAPISKALAVSIKEFQLMVSQAKPAHDLIEHAVKSSLLCGVDRCVFVVKLPNKDMLVSRYHAQVSDDIEIKKLNIPIKEPHLFTLLIEKNRSVFLNESNRGKYWKSIPDKVKMLLGVKSFFANSIFANSHAMGLMYVDKVKGELTQAEFSQFQGVCRLLSKGIVQSAHNKRDKHSGS